MKKELNAGLASFGLSGRVFHYPFLITSKYINLKKIVVRNSSEKSLPSFPESVEIVSDFDELLNDPEIDMIIVNTPDHLHFNMVEKALKAGKHVIVEKPFTKSLKEAELLFSLAEKKKLLITAYHNRRFDGDFMTVKHLLKNRILTDVVEYKSSYNRFKVVIDNSAWRESPETGTGVLFNIGTHMIDQAVDLFGKPESIFCVLRHNRPGTNVEDFAVINLYYKKIFVELRSTYAEKILSPRFHINALNGSFVKYGFDPQEAVLLKGGIPCNEEWGRESEADWGMLDTVMYSLKKYRTLAGNYALFYNNIYNAVTGKEPLEVKPMQVLTVLEILGLCRESSETGKIKYLI